MQFCDVELWLRDFFGVFDLASGGCDIGACSSNLWGYVTDLVFDYLDQLDRSKEIKIHVKWGKINKFGSKHGMKGQDRCKLDSKLNSKYYELFGHPNQKTRGSTDSIH